jgi:hypothetical protein
MYLLLSWIMIEPWLLITDECFVLKNFAKFSSFVRGWSRTTSLHGYSASEKELLLWR